MEAQVFHNLRFVGMLLATVWFILILPLVVVVAVWMWQVAKDHWRARSEASLTETPVNEVASALDPVVTRKEIAKKDIDSKESETTDHVA